MRTHRNVRSKDRQQVTAIKHWLKQDGHAKLWQCAVCAYLTNENPDLNYRLHCFAQSGNAYKAALMLNLCKVEWQPVFVDYFNGEHRGEDFLALNEAGEVPVLETGNTVLSQSGVILDYLAEETGLYGGCNTEERREILRWILFDNHKFTSYLATLRYIRCFATDVDKSVDEFFEKRTLAALQVADQRLTDNQYVYFLDEARIEIAGFPALASWRERMQELPGWGHPYDIMPKS